MEIRERLLAFAAGSPIGGAASPGPTDPYDEFEYDERPTSFGDRVLRFATASVLMLVVACAIATIAYAAQKGQWDVDVAPKDETTYVYIKWSDTENNKFVSFEHDGIKAYKIGYTVTTSYSGSTVKKTIEGPVYYDKKDKIVDKSHSKKKNYEGGVNAKDLKKELEPSWAPDGWEKAASASTSVNRNDNNKPSGSNDSVAKEEDDLDDKLISKNPPKFALSFNFFKYAAENLVWTFCRGLAESATSLAEWCISLVSSTASTAFTSDFTNGPFGQFYTMASKLSKGAFQPYAMAFLGLTFGVALMHQLDVRRKMAGVDIMASLAFVVMMFAVSYTLIVHAMDICAAVYVLAQHLVGVVNNTLASMGIDTTNSIGIKEQVTSPFDALTYAQAGTSFILLILAIVSLVACVACLFTVLTTIFVRVGEIYLRAAASPLCLAFFADDKSRPMGVGYLKRFAAVCFQAVMIVIAIGMIPLINTVATELIAPITSDTSTLNGFGGAAAALIPSMCSVLCITEIVNKSKVVANSLFGLA